MNRILELGAKLRKRATAMWRNSGLVVEQTPFHQTYPSRVSAEMVNSRAFVSRQFGYIYFRVPKAANSFTLANLYNCENGIRATLEQIDSYKNRGTILDLLTETEVRQIEEHFFLFTIVRNPYTRFLSSYLDKIVRKKKQSARVYEALEKSPEQEISIDEYLHFLEHNDSLLTDAHWARQSDLIPVPDGRIHFVGKFEELDSAMKTIMRRIYGHGEIFMLANSHSTHASNRMDSYVNRPIAERVYRLYEPDFDRFRYSKDLPNV